MMRGSDSTTAMSSSRPPMTAGPMLRKRRFFSAGSYDDCANALAAKPESASAAAKMVMRDSFLEGMRVSLNRSHCTSGGGRSWGGWRWDEGIVRRRGASRDGVRFGGRTWSASGQRDQGVARRPGGLPHIGNRVRFGNGIWFNWLGSSIRNVFVWYFFEFVQFGAEVAEACEVLNGAAVLALGLGLVAQKEFPGVGLLSVHVEARGEREIAILGAGDFDIAIAGHLGGHETELLALRGRGFCRGNWSTYRTRGGRRGGGPSGRGRCARRRRFPGS